jgi:Flp pilus assembly protein TadD
MPPDELKAKIDKFAALVAKNPENELARFSLGSALFEAGRFADAEPHFAKALALKGDWVMAYILRARCLIRLGRVDEARPLLATGRQHSLAQHHEAPVEEIDEILAELG